MDGTGLFEMGMSLLAQFLGQG